MHGSESAWLAKVQELRGLVESRQQELGRQRENRERREVELREKTAAKVALESVWLRQEELRSKAQRKVLDAKAHVEELTSGSTDSATLQKLVSQKSALEERCVAIGRGCAAEARRVQQYSRGIDAHLHKLGQSRQRKRQDYQSVLAKGDVGAKEGVLSAALGELEWLNGEAERLREENATLLKKCENLQASNAELNAKLRQVRHTSREELDKMEEDLKKRTWQYDVLLKLQRTKEERIERLRCCNSELKEELEAIERQIEQASGTLCELAGGDD